MKIFNKLLKSQLIFFFFSLMYTVQCTRVLYSTSVLYSELYPARRDKIPTDLEYLQYSLTID